MVKQIFGVIWRGLLVSLIILLIVNTAGCTTNEVKKESQHVTLLNLNKNVSLSGYGYLPLSRRYGDINGDSQVNQEDLKLVRDHLSGVKLITDQYAFYAADINADNLINNQDLQLFQRCVNGEINIGGATFYGTDGGGGNCSFQAIPGDYFVSAMNTVDYAGSAICGAYIELTGPRGTITVRITDRLPEGNKGDMDLSEKCYPYIGDPIAGRVPIYWKIVPGNMSTPIVYHFKEGSNPYWTAVQIVNHRYPIKKFEYRTASGEFKEVKREYYNYFVETAGMGFDKYTFRVTDIYGQTLIDNNITHLENGYINGAAQFPVVNSGGKYRLEVKGGYGGGYYSKGEEVAISWLKPKFDNHQQASFKKWLSNIKTIENSLSTETKLIMPGADVMVEAIYDLSKE